MKTIHYLVLLLPALLLTACYNDDKVWDAIDTEAQRLEALEAWQATVTANITALQTLVNTHDYVTGVAPLITGGDTVGYTLSFHTHAPVSLYNGAPGRTGDKGDTGPAGTPGADGQTPVVSITHADDGNWYWTLNGSLLTGADGQPLRANGPAGAVGPDGPTGDPGTPGAAGTPAVTPLLSTGANLPDGAVAPAERFDDALYLSPDGGTTWTRITGTEGPDNRYAFAFDLTDDDYVTLTLTGPDDRLRIPRYRPLRLSFTSDGAPVAPSGYLLLNDATYTLGYEIHAGETAASDVHVTAFYTDGDGNTRQAGLLTTPDGQSTIVPPPYIGSYTLSVSATDNAGHSCAYTFTAERTYFNGKGTDEEPYTISTAEELFWVNSNPNASYLLTRDIDLSGIEEWTPIVGYNGTFDGGGHAIRGLKVKYGNCAGLFGSIDGGTVKNLTLLSPWAEATEGGCCGALAGLLTNEGSLENCRVTGGTCSAATYGAGGMVGQITRNATLTDCHEEGMTVKAAGKNDVYSCAGGLVGEIYCGGSATTVTFTQCSATHCTVSGEKSGCGGLVGGSKGRGLNLVSLRLYGCYTTGTVSSKDFIGGLVGIAEESKVISHGCYSGCILNQNGNLGGPTFEEDWMINIGKYIDIRYDATYYITGEPFPKDATSKEYYILGNLTYQRSIDEPMIKAMNAAVESKTNIKNIYNYDGTFH